MSSPTAIIGGTGLANLKDFEVSRREVMRTPYGEPSAPLVYGQLCGARVVFLARHGIGHRIPPHEVNYRANLWALHEAGVRQVIAFAAVGGISTRMAPTLIAIPDQIIDYTWSRQHTYFQGELSEVTHIDFTQPYSAALRQKLVAAGRAIGLDVIDGGTYGATNGPRLETTAEINRMERDGCDLVGMTGMPETALARELGLDYAAVSVIANWAAGRGDGEISMAEISANLETGMARARQLLEACLHRDAHPD